MSRPFARILEPSDPWFRQPGDVEELTGEFRGKYDGISVCHTTSCSAELAVAAFYGNTTRPTPLRPAWLGFTDDEVTEAGGRLKKTDAIPPWPEEYNDAHHDVVEGQDAVASSMARRTLAEPSRRHLVDRVRLVCLIFGLSQRDNAPPEFVKKVRKRVRRIHRDESALFEQVVALVPAVRELLVPPK